ncbi:Pycsar system effector family protein [Streptomyces sp. NPDC055144]
MAHLRDLQNLHSALADVRAELTRADHKAATLLALFSAISAGIVATFTVRRSGMFALWNGAEWLAWLGIGCMTASLVHLLFCVRPGGVSQLGRGGYFATYAQFRGRAGDLVAHLSRTSDADLEQCTQLIELSLLATRKYRLIARAVDLLGCGLALVAAAALLDAMR